MSRKSNKDNKNIFVEMVTSSDDLTDFHKEVFLRLHDRLEASDMLDNLMYGDLYVLAVSIAYTDAPKRVEVYDCVAEGDIPVLPDVPIWTWARRLPGKWLKDQIEVHHVRESMARAGTNTRESIVRAGVAVGAVVTAIDQATSIALSKTRRVAVALPSAISRTIREA
jgi:hypothetical protein